MFIAAMLMLAGCGEAQQDPASNRAEPISANIAAPAPGEASVEPPAPGTPGGLSDDRTPIAEGALDLKGPEGAGQVAQQFAALFEQRRFADARKLWGDNGVAGDSAALLSELESYREVHAQIGKPSDPEGAAGSIYVTIPLVLYGRDSRGTEFNMKATATMRRVNDVPGSTAAQRSWHLQQLARG